MKVDFRKWSLADKKELMELCNAVDRTFLSDRLPNPYTDDDADWWLNLVAEIIARDTLLVGTTAR